MSEEVQELEQEEEPQALVIPDDIDQLKQLLQEERNEKNKINKALRAERKTGKTQEDDLRSTKLEALQAKYSWLDPNDLADVPRAKWDSEIERLQAVAARISPPPSEENAQEQAKLKAQQQFVNTAGGAAASTTATEKITRAAADKKLAEGEWSMADYQAAFNAGQIALGPAQMGPPRR